MRAMGMSRLTQKTVWIWLSSQRRKHYDGNALPRGGCCRTHGYRLVGLAGHAPKVEDKVLSRSIAGPGHLPKKASSLNYGGDYSYSGRASRHCLVDFHWQMSVTRPNDKLLP